jgi:hypothetical protein
MTEPWYVEGSNGDEHDGRGDEKYAQILMYRMIVAAINQLQHRATSGIASVRKYCA